MIQFFLNDQPVSVCDTPPEFTLLEYIREVAQLTGTKEGCGTGDCGACTCTVLSELTPKDIRLNAFNSCITPLAAMHGQRVFTVEYLHRDGTLHPIQQSMIDLNGSQCGFCTPGFVMALWAWLSVPHEERETLKTSLSGNLCRCTGYVSICSAAAEASSKQPAQLLAMVPTLAAPPAKLGFSRFDHRSIVCPTSEEELQGQLRSYPNSQLINGGTDIMVKAPGAQLPGDQWIYIGNISSLKTITYDNKALLIGGAVTYGEALPWFKKYLTSFANLVDRIGSTQIRNRGTLAGNLANASPIGDCAPVLLALDASLNVHHESGTRDIPLREFFVGYKKTLLKTGEYIRNIRIPCIDVHNTLKVYKFSKRFDDDISSVCFALFLEFAQQENRVIAGARLALGGVADRPLRVVEVEKGLIGQEWNLKTVHQAQNVLKKTLTPLSDVRSSAQYRIALVCSALERAFLEGVGSDCLDLSREMPYA